MHFHDTLGIYFSSHKLCFKFFYFKIFAYFRDMTKISVAETTLMVVSCPVVLGTGVCRTRNWRKWPSVQIRLFDGRGVGQVGSGIENIDQFLLQPRTGAVFAMF